MNWRVFLLVFLLPSIVCAQALPPIPPGEDRIVPLPKGEKAPYSGQLFDQDTALRWANWLQQYKLRLKEEQKMCSKLSSIELRYQSKLLNIEKRRANAIESDLRARLKRSEEARLQAEHEARNPPWYTTRTFGIIVGVVGTAAIFSASIWAFSATSN